MSNNKRKLSICFITPEYKSIYGVGGIATYVDVTSQEMVKLGNDVTIISLSNSYASYNSGGIQVELISGDVSRNRYIKKMLNILRRVGVNYVAEYVILQMLFLKHFQLVSKNKSFDIIEAVDYNADSALINIVRNVFWRKPVFLLRLHSGNLIIKDYYRVQKSLAFQVRMLAERINYKLADRIAAPSIKLKKLSKKYTGKHIDHVPYIVDLGNIQKQIKRFRPSTKDQRVILFPGRIQDGKGVIVLMEAALKLMNKVPSVQIYMLGRDTNSAPDGTSMEQYVRKMIPEKHMTKFNFIGQVERNKLAQFFSKSALVVIPSLYDNYPYTALEAMAVGKAIIGSSGTGVEEMIEEYKSGLVFQNSNANDLSDKMEKLLKDVKLRNQFERNAYEAMNQKMNKEDMANRYYKYLLSIAK